MANRSLWAIFIALLVAVTLQFHGCKSDWNKPNERQPPWKGSPYTLYLGEAGEKYEAGALLDSTTSAKYVGDGGEGVICKARHGNGNWQAVKAVFTDLANHAIKRDKEFALALDESAAQGCVFIRQAVWIHRGNFKSTKFPEENKKGFERFRQAVYDVAKPGKKKFDSKGKGLRRGFVDHDKFHFKVVGRKDLKNSQGVVVDAGPTHPASLDLDNGNGTNTLIGYEWVEFDYKSYTKNGLRLDEVWGHIYMALVAIAGVHSVNYVHNDIDRGNIVIDSNGVLKLTDFGMASRGRHPSCSGKPYYFAPETFSKRYFLDHHSYQYTQARDLFQIGNVMLEAVLDRPGEVYQCSQYGLKFGITKDDRKGNLKVVVEDKGKFKKFQKSYGSVSTETIDEQTCVSTDAQAGVVEHLATKGLEKAIEKLEKKFKGARYLSPFRKIIEQLCHHDPKKRGTAKQILDQHFFADGGDAGWEMIRFHVRQEFGKDYDPQGYNNFATLSDRIR